MSFIFDGKTFAQEREKELRKEVEKLEKKGVEPKLVSIIVGDDPASVLYVNLKKKAAERIGCELLVVSFRESVSKDEILARIKKYNKDKSVHGIMVQLPLPKNFSEKDRVEIINTIAKEKDVDGLRCDSPFLTPTVRAIIEVIKNATFCVLTQTSGVKPLRVVVVGAKGFEGQKIFKVLKEMGYDTEGVDRKTRNFRGKTKLADILISVTGSPGIIGEDEIKEGAIVIDIGSPKGDVRTDEVLEKASFISPVPGGVGPVTISSLLENLVESASLR